MTFIKLLLCFLEKLFLRRQLLKTCLRFTIIFFMLLVFLAISKEGFLKELPIAGQDKLQPVILEEHSEALLRWAKKGLKDVILVNVDAHDDLRWIEPSKIEILRKIKQDKNWKAFKEKNSAGKQGLYNIGSFIHAAYKLNIVSKVYWIIPFSYFDFPNPEERLNNFLNGYGFPQKDVNGFIMHKGCYKGTYYGTPLAICSTWSLPDIKDPVILTIDADFFPPFAISYKKDILTAMSLFFTRLKEKSYSILDATISTSIDGGFLNISRRWIVDSCSEFLSQPQKITGVYPKKWLIFNLADIYYQNGQAKSLLDLTKRFQENYSQDISLISYQAFALLAVGDKEKAFQVARKVALFNKNYAYLLADLGQCLIDKGEIDTALKYFKEAYKLNTQMNFRHKNLADVLFKAGRYEQALYYYDIYREKNGLFPVAFNIGLTKLKQDNNEQAGIWFRRGVESLKSEKYTSLNSKIDIESVKKAVEYFKQKKEYKKANFLISHPSFKNYFKSAISEKGVEK